MLPFVFQRKRRNTMCILRLRFKKLARVTLNSIGGVWQAGNSGKSFNSGPKQYSVKSIRTNAADEVWRQSAEEFPLAWGRSAFAPFRLSTDWVRPTYIMEGNLIWMYISSKKPSEKHPEKCLNKCLSTFSQTSWHIKWAITLLKLEVKKVVLFLLFSSFDSNSYPLGLMIDLYLRKERHDHG